MKQEEKELLLKDLCARLPYGVKCEYYDCCEGDYDEGTICGFERQEYIQIDGVCIHVEEVKPYLFPLSSMTEEQFKEMQEIIGNPNEACISVNTSGLELWLNSVDTDPTIWLDTVFELQDWLNKNNFDYRGLIPMGLAIDATGLNIY